MCVCVFQQWQTYPSYFFLCRKKKKACNFLLFFPMFIKLKHMLCWSSCEEIPQVQGKRNPSKTVGVARGYQTAGTLKP